MAFLVFKPDHPPKGNSKVSQLLKLKRGGVFLLGDNLKVSHEISRQCREKIQVAYLDPPFFSGVDRSIDGKKVYTDRWRSQDDYLVPIESLLFTVRSFLKDSGSIFLHCDYRMSAYLKVLGDSIFGFDNYLNEIVWGYKTGGVPSKVGFARKHDTIHVWAKDRGKVFWNQLKEKSYLSHRYGFKNITVSEDEGGVFRLTHMRDVWDIPALRGNSSDRVRYPTQKPAELLRRVIEATTKKGDIVFDPFSGSGTTAVVATALERRWIVIDASRKAQTVLQGRLVEKEEW